MSAMADTVCIVSFQTRSTPLVKEGSKSNLDGCKNWTSAEWDGRVDLSAAWRSCTKAHIAQLASL